MHMTVIWDPETKVPPRTNFEREKQGRVIEQLERRGVVMLPTMPERLAINPVADAFFRHWGEGWDFENVQATRGCPMLNYVTPEMQEVHWAARIEPNGKGSAVSGVLRLVPLTGIMSAVAGGLTGDGMPTDLAKLGGPDAFGGWTIRGRSRVASTVQGYFASTIYGYVTGVRVKWSAVSFV